MADINVTSLVDVAFTLLIIFIITAPILQGGIEVEVPETEVSSLTADDRTLIVTVDRDGIVYIAETAVERAEFSQTFNQLATAVTKSYRLQGVIDMKVVNNALPRHY